MIIERRYSEFDAIRHILIRNFPGITIPSLPSETIGRSTDPSFIEKRKIALQIFLDGVLNDPKLRADRMFQLFMTTPDKMWEATSKELKKIKPHLIQLNNIGDANSNKKTNKKNTVNNHSKKKKIVKGTSTNSNRENIAASNKYKQEEGNIITEVNKEGKFIEDEHEELDSEKNSSMDNTDTAKKEIDINIEE